MVITLCVLLGVVPFGSAALHYLSMKKRRPGPAVHISGSLNVYSRAKGIADHYWTWAVFFSYLIIYFNKMTSNEIDSRFESPSVRLNICLLNPPSLYPSFRSSVKFSIFRLLLFVC